MRREHAPLRPRAFGASDAVVAGASQLAWYDAAGTPMTSAAWDDVRDRTVQLVAASDDGASQVLVVVVVHGPPDDAAVTTPTVRADAAGSASLSLQWDSACDALRDERIAPGDTIALPVMSMRVYAVTRPSGG